MSVLPLSQQIEECRLFWANVARKNHWYAEPFFVQVWSDDKGEVLDSVSHQGLTCDILITPDDEYVICYSCGTQISIEAGDWVSEDYYYWHDECY